MSRVFQETCNIFVDVFILMHQRNFRGGRGRDQSLKMMEFKNDLIYLIYSLVNEPLENDFHCELT